MARIILRKAAVEYPVPHLQNRSFIGAVKNATVGGLIKREKNIRIRALDGVTITLKDGDRLGLLGRNGAGKTTMLKVMASILPPTEGRVRVEGRISPLISMMLGLDSDVSGYENIRIRGRLMGYSEEEIEQVIPEIADFTELEQYLDLPLKTYSSGMRMRLTFATSTAFRPEVLLLDEWLGTGDREFRNKATKRLRSIIDQSGIFVFASHSRDLHERVSNKGAVLENGRLIFFGDIQEAFEMQDRRLARAERRAEMGLESSVNLHELESES
ncbi:ABC transporter ATP-binding protein [Hyphococcus sp.]|uniref:ABC transporter ATP-binding protein n=1 Tax=Hyphococcus sp. TaxID=2038636 RepID=UPI00208BC7FB|nr:MAG: sugar ABC transporter ATP-binding protein [Marinicaulis sp.]